MAENDIDGLYPGYYMGANIDTKQRIDNLSTISKDVLAENLKGEKNPDGFIGLNFLITKYGVRVLYSEKALK